MERRIHLLHVQDAANLLGETDQPEFDITGRTECFYRVAAVDGAGNRGAYGPYLEVRHPRLVDSVLPPAEAGKPYQAAIPCVLSRGQYVSYLRKGPSLWQGDDPVFSLVGAPVWLAIDAKTGVLSGTPPAGAGRAAFRVRVEVGGRGRDERECVIEEERRE
jgi:hypothetical protein